MLSVSVLFALLMLALWRSLLFLVERAEPVAVGPTEKLGWGREKAPPVTTGPLGGVGWVLKVKPLPVAAGLPGGGLSQG